MAKWPRVGLGGLLVPVAVIAVWQLLKSINVLDYQYLPAPREVLAALVDLAPTGELADDVVHTLAVALLAAGITLTLGAALGLAIGLIPALPRYTMASIDFMRTIPAVALVPVGVLTFGPIVATELLLAVYAALWPIVLNTAGGVAAVHPRQYDVARVLHLSRLTTVRKIVIPAVFPSWLIGARLAAVIGLLVAIVAEMIMYPRGLGGGLIESLNALAPARMWAYALVCGAIGYLLNAVLRRTAGAVLPASPANADRDVAVAVAPTVTQPIAPPRGLLPVAALLIIWQLIGSDDSLSFPPPAEWLRAIAHLHSDGVLPSAIAQTLGTYLFGMVLGAVIGAVVGAAIGVSRRIDRALTPSSDFMAAVPGAALVPVAVLLLGPSSISGIAVVALIVSWPILLNTVTAMRGIPVVRLEMSRTMGLSPMQRWSKVVLPSATPGVMLGVRVAASMGIIITLLVDIFGASAGLGRLLVESQQRFESAAAWGLLLMIGGFGYLVSVGLARLERRLAIPDTPSSSAGRPQRVTTSGR